jgi:hypothetical protein
MRSRVGREPAPPRRAGVLRPRLPAVVMVFPVFLRCETEPVPVPAPATRFWPTATARATTVEIQRTFN